MIHHLKKLQHWRMRMALAGPACTSQPSTPDWPAGSARAREAPAAAKTDGVLLTDTPHPSSCASSVTISRASRELGAQHAAERRQSPPQQEPRARARSRPASRASTADRYKQVLPVPYACASAATSSDGVSWCILEAWEDRAAEVLENLIAVRISTAPKHRWQPVSEIRSEI